LPLPNLAETFSNKGFSPNWIVIFAVVSNVGTPVLIFNYRLPSHTLNR
jgi:hypothetical protein